MLFKQDLSNFSDEPLLWRFATQLSEQGYAHKTTVRYIAVAKRFLAYLSKRNVAVEAAKPADVESYLRKELRRFRRLRQRRPAALGSWHHKRTAPIHLLLRTVQKDWPPIVPPTGDLLQIGTSFTPRVRCAISLPERSLTFRVLGTGL